jgi:peptide/nickel transport system substrate-binding protein
MAMIRTLVASFSHAMRGCAIAALGALLLTAPATAQTPAVGQPTPGGIVSIGYPLEPVTLNPYFASTDLGARTFTELVLDGLARGAPDGSYLPILAAEIPTQANGDVSPDGTVVTWKLKPGVTWSDGQPFTGQDVVFTYKMIMDPANPIQNRTDYVVMDSVAAPDDLTVVVTYRQLYAPYRLAFPSVFPAHVFNGQTDLSQAPFNRAETVGTGPFVDRAWAAGDTLTLDRNPNYRELGKPHLDGVVVKFVPSKDAEIQALEAGDLDAAYWLDPTYLPQLATLPGVSVDPAPGGVQELVANTSCPSGPQQGDPACPHPVLGDVRVRQAIELAIDKQALVHGLLADTVKVAASPLLATGLYGVDLPPSEFSPAKAQQLLDQAGWIVGSDGIRSKGDVRAHLTLISAVGNTLNEQTAQVIDGDLQAVGIETDAREVPGGVLLGGFVGHSPLNLGNFDLAVLTRTVPIDPQAYLRGQYASDQVPNPQLQTGSNWERTQDSKLDQALTAAGNTLDDTQRQAAYVSAAELIHADEAVLPLFPYLVVDARKTYLQGWQTNVNDVVIWNIQDWWLAR